VIFSGIIVVGVGILDDKFGLPPKVKLMGQLIACIVLIYFGVRIFSLTIPFTNYSINLYVIGIFVTIIWIVFLMNAFNFIDGLDGLASGVAIISSVIFFIILINLIPHTIPLFAKRSLVLASYLSLYVIGATLGFLVFNFYPAKVFLGDSGSMFLGFMLAVIAIIGALKSAAALAIFIPVFVIGVPVFDAVYVIVKRMKAGVPISKADKGHLHHKLLALGFTHRQVVIILYILAALFGGISLFLTKYH
jgi:UDP-GlcNAc:undecaprenyl-phosphate GlcNAc-1-phosphate transferase